jgi:hypothetical protein
LGRHAAVTNIWIVYVEVRGTAASALPPTSGAFVECYVPADTPEDASALARTALMDDGYTIHGDVECISFDHDAWDDENDPDRGVRTAAALAESQRSLQYGPFRAWTL